MKNFKHPNLKGPRYRKPQLNFFDESLIKEFKRLNPKYKNISVKVIRGIMKEFNESLVRGVIKYREGVELPSSLGYIFIGSCERSITSNNIDYKRSIENGKVLKNQNWDTDGYLAKIFYTNYSAKYRFKNRDVWGFTACRNFKRTVAKEYPRNWSKYIKIMKSTKIKSLFDTRYKNTINALKTYDEFEI